MEVEVDKDSGSSEQDKHKRVNEKLGRAQCQGAPNGYNASVQHTIGIFPHISLSIKKQETTFTTPFDCDYMKFDANRYPTCFHNREFPTDCTPDNCPLLRGVLK